MTRVLIAGLVLVGGALAGAAQDKKPDPLDPKPKTDPPPTSITGTFNATSGERDGAALPADEAREVTFRITRDRIIGTRGDQTEFFSAAYALTRVPDALVPTWSLELKTDAKGATAGLVRRDGEYLTLVYAEPGAPAPKEFKTDKGQVMFTMRAPFIEGGYTVASGERDGKPIPAAELKDAVVRITGGRVVGTDRDRREFLFATYALDMTTAPWTLRLTPVGPDGLSVPGAPIPALIKRGTGKDANVLTLIYALPGGAAPTEFKTRDRQVLLRLRAFVLDPPPPPNKFSSSP